jgi:hypothetical protein
MSKAISFYDWSLSLKHKSENDQTLQREDINSLGITDNNFKDFIKKWKERNLS